MPVVSNHAKTRMKCTICGKSTLPGAMLCGPCRAALKRARYVSVQMIPPRSLMQGRPRRLRESAGTVTGQPGAAHNVPQGPSGAAIVPPLDPVPAATAAPRSTLRSLAIGAAAVAVLGTVAYFGQARETAPEFATNQGQATMAAPVSEAPGTVDAVTSSNARGNAEVAPAAASGVAANDSPATVPLSGTARATEGRSTSKVLAAASRPATAVGVGSRASPGVDAFGQGAETPRQAPVLPPPVPAAPPPPDRWQSLQSELARCGQEGGFGGFICDQRARLAACEGYWGRVAQCPLPPENPGGQ